MRLLVLLILLAILAALELFIYRKHALDNLSLDVRFSKRVARFGETVEVIETAQNSKRLPLPFLLLKFEAPTSLQFLDMTNTTSSDLLYREDMLTMKSFSQHTRRIKACCTQRGYYSFFRVNITTSDLLLIDKLNRNFENDAHLTVLPEEIPTSELQPLLSITLSDVMQRRTLLTDPFSFSGIREYQPWDPMRAINWTATAKAGDFMVNQQASTSTRQITIFLNLDFYDFKESSSLLEKSISLAYSYMLALCKSGIPCALYTNGRDVLTELPVSLDMSACLADMEHRGEALARIDLACPVIPFDELLEAHGANVRKDDYTIIISPRCDSAFRRLLVQLKPYRSSLNWIMPCYKTTPHVKLDAELMNIYQRWEMMGHD